MRTSRSDKEKCKGRRTVARVKWWLAGLLGLFLICLVVRILVSPPNVTAIAIAYFKMNGQHAEEVSRVPVPTAADAETCV